MVKAVPYKNLTSAVHRGERHSRDKHALQGLHCGSLPVHASWNRASTVKNIWSATPQAETSTSKLAIRLHQRSTPTCL